MIGFILIGEMKNDYKIDADRVYLTGISNSGMLTTGYQRINCRVRQAAVQVE
jgi:poly(3-hydroxybutyrate) depolymerase